MKIFRRWAGLLLACLMLFAAAVPAHAEEGFNFQWDGGRDDDSDQPHCKSIFMMNLDTGTVVYTLNPDERLPMASMTKIMTYIIAYENIPDIENAKITVPQIVEDDLEGTGSSLAGVSVGEELTGLQLLYLLMVPSGNDAALTLMEYVDGLYKSGRLAAPDAADPEDPGAVAQEGPQATPAPEGEEEPGRVDYTGDSYFVSLMNKKAEELGCKNTHFTNPHGLHHPDHYSTARDTAIIAEYAMTLPNFSAITSTFAYDKAPTNTDPDGDTQYNTNKLLQPYEDANGRLYFYTYAKGIKTGSHDQAGHCIAASATAYGYTYVAVLMGDMEGYENDIHYEMMDARSLFRWALTELEKKTIDDLYEISAGEKYYIRMKKLIRDLETFFYELDFESSYNIQIEIADFKTVLKTGVMGIMAPDSLMERVDEYIKISARLLKSRVLVFMNVMEYFSEEEWRQIERTAMYEGIYLLCFERNDKLKVANKVVIDSDCCRVV